MPVTGGLPAQEPKWWSDLTGTQEFGALLSQLGVLTQAGQCLCSGHMENILIGADWTGLTFGTERSGPREPVGLALPLPPRYEHIRGFGSWGRLHGAGDPARRSPDDVQCS